MSILIVLAFAASSTAQKADKDTGTKNTADVRGAIWRDPGSMGSLNLLYTSHEIGVYTQAVRKRIAELNAL
jgi:hypothetical protein